MGDGGGGEGLALLEGLSFLEVVASLVEFEGFEGFDLGGGGVDKGDDLGDCGGELGGCGVFVRGAGGGG